jgi:hypothetical protein
MRSIVKEALCSQSHFEFQTEKLIIIIQKITCEI